MGVGRKDKRKGKLNKYGITATIMGGAPETPLTNVVACSARRHQ
jgi:hypothetical protein